MRICLLLLLLPISSCVRPSKLILKNQLKHNQALTREINTNFISEKKGSFTFNRAEINNLYLSRNSELSKAKNNLTRARKAWDNRWKQYLPTVGFNTSIITNLEEISTLTTSDLNIFARLVLNVPEPTRTYAEIARFKLNLLLSELNYSNEQRKSQLQVEEFILAAELIHRYESKVTHFYIEPRKLNATTALTEKVEPYRNSKINQLSSEIKKSLNIRDENLYKINLKGSKRIKLPKTTFFTKKDPSFFLEEHLKLSSLNLTASRLIQLGADLDKYPKLNLGFNTQPLYNSTSAEGFNNDVLDLAESNLSIATSYNPDFWGTGSDAYLENNLESSWDNEVSNLRRLFEEIQKKQKELSALELNKKSLEETLKNATYIPFETLKSAYTDILNAELTINRIKLEMILGNEALYKKYTQ